MYQFTNMSPCIVQRDEVTVQNTLRILLPVRKAKYWINVDQLDVYCV